VTVVEGAEMPRSRPKAEAGCTAAIIRSATYPHEIQRTTVPPLAQGAHAEAGLRINYDAMERCAEQLKSGISRDGAQPPAASL
jgi:hypothetical protein